MTLHRKQQGFTIVELLIVIVVIGILAALVVTTFSGIQQKGRNTERQTDINAVHSQVEAYYAQNGRYPTLTDMNTATFRSANLKGLDEAAIKDPKWTTGASCVASGAVTFSATAASNCYSYAVFADDGTTACDNSATECQKYTLTATNEPNTTTYEKKSLN